MSPIAHPSLRPIWAITFAVSSLLTLVSEVSGAEAVLLTATKQMKPSRVKVVLEVDGHLLPGPAKENAKPKEHTLKAKGHFLYEERFSRAGQGESLRYYEESHAEISVDGRPSQATLRDDRRFIAVEGGPPGRALRSLQGALSREELELIEVPGSSHVVDQLLAGRSVKVGETWNHDDQILAQLLNLTGVTANDVTSKLTSVDDKKQQAQLEISGKIIGSAEGVLTEIQLRGKYRFDLQKRRVTWLVLGIQEQRSAGLSKPGLRVKARLRMLIEECPPMHLSAESLEAIAAGAPQPTELLEYEPPNGRFSLMHDRNWHVFAEHSGLIVMRLIEDEQLVAQCNLRVLPPQGVGQSVTLAEFQTEVRAVLGSAAQQIIDSNESSGPDGVRQLRIAVVGQVANAPIHWIYYQLTDPAGQRVTCVFTMSGENVDRFGAADVSFMGGLALLAPANGGEEEAEEVPNDKKVAARS